MLARPDAAQGSSQVPVPSIRRRQPFVPVFPVAPQQHARWAAPVGDPTLEAIATASSALFSAGMSDPRGCEYRSVGLSVGRLAGDSIVVATSAWLLPAVGQNPCFAVAWNGLVYPVATLGPPVDVRRDLHALLARPDASGMSRRRPMGEEGGVRADTLTSIKLPLMLRLGLWDLARAYALALGREGSRDASRWRDRFASDWTWAVFDRAVCAHMRSQDLVALESLRLLAASRSALQGMVAEPRALGYLSVADDLLDDQERRHAQAHRGVNLAATLAIGDPRARAEALVQALDEVCARQLSQPGDVDLAEDPIVRALIAQGTGAVEALLSAFEHDNRLTRSVHYWRDFHPQRTVLGAHEAAYAALAAILETDFFAPASTGDSLSARGAATRAQIAARIRAFWVRWGSAPIAQRWFATLADDHEAPSQWLSAADSITAPFGASRMRGEGLRGLAGPSVTELMTRRLGHLLRDRPEGGDVHWENSACAMVLNLARWDAAHSVGALTRATHEIADAMISRSDQIDYPGLCPGRCLTELAVKRAEAGDAGALDEWARWIRAYSPTHLDDRSTQREWFKPLWLYPALPSVAAAARDLFGVPAGRWLPIDDLTNREGMGYDRTHLLETELLSVPEFNRAVMAALRDRTRLGWWMVVRADHISVEQDANHSWTSNPGGALIDPPPVGTRIPYRRGDYYASLCTALPGAPVFRAYWPDARRQRALAELERFVSARARAPSVAP